MSKIIGPQYADKWPCGHLYVPGATSCPQCAAEARSVESMQRLRESNRQVANDLRAQQSQSQSRPSSFPSHQPSSFQPQQPSSFQPQQQSHQNPLDRVDWEFWGQNRPQIGSGGLIVGIFMWIAIGGAVWLVVAILPFLLAVLGFLFSAALVIGAIVGGIWLLVIIVQAFSDVQNPPQ